jgi:hypothetical protein
VKQIQISVFTGFYRDRYQIVFGIDVVIVIERNTNAKTGVVILNFLNRNVAAAFVGHVLGGFLK